MPATRIYRKTGLLLWVVCAMALSACGKNGQENPLPAPTPQTSKNGQADTPQAASSSALKIKGLYIGMDIQSVPSAMMAILAEQQLSDFSFTDPMQASDGTQCVLMYTKPFLHTITARMRDRYGEARAGAKVEEEMLTSCINSDGVLMAKTGGGSKVARIEFNDVKDIFHAEGLPPADFVRKLSAELHIPEMKPDASKTSWGYTSPDGVLVVVDAKEVLGIPMVRLYMSKGGR